jgi:hypothetical protein
MDDKTAPGPEKKQGKGFKRFATVRLFAGVIATVGVLWLISLVIPHFDKGPSSPDAHTSGHSTVETADRHDAATDHGAAAEPSHQAPVHQAMALHGNASDTEAAAAHDTDSLHGKASGTVSETGHGASPAAHDGAASHDDTGAQAAHGDEPHGAAVHVASTDTHDQPDQPPSHGSETTTDHSGEPTHGSSGGNDAGHGQATAAHGAADADAGHGAPAAGGHGAPPAEPLVKGVAFMNAFIEPIRFEVEERFWGWRPNDIIEFTDNVNNFQLGVLETTRRTIEALHEQISRTGSTQAHNKHLENARNNFMIGADDYMLPSAENSYSEAIDSLREYKEQLENGTAFFYTRTANLLPLLRAYEYLLGSCDDNLVKTHEEDGKPVSFTKADDYFYYSKGVASAMLSILEAVAVDFSQTIEPRRGTEVLHHAIEALHHASEVDPLIILNAGSNSFLANHRLNLAGPISHARFYIGLLIETLST